MSKKQRKGKNAQRKKRRNQSMTRGKSAASLDQRQMAEREQRERHQEETLGAGVRARAKSVPLPMGVKVLVGLMAFTMLTMMGAVSFASVGQFDLAEWITGGDVDVDKPSPTNSVSAMTATQRHAMDATGKFDHFFVVDDESGLTLSEAVASHQTYANSQAATKFKTDADSKREEILAADKEKIQARQEAKTAREEAKENSIWNRFAKGVDQVRDGIASLFTSTWGAISGTDRAEETGDYVENPDAGQPVVDTGATTDYGNENTIVVDGNGGNYEVEYPTEPSGSEVTVSDGNVATGTVGNDTAVTFE